MKFKIVIFVIIFCSGSFFLKSKVNEKLVCCGIKKIKLYDYFVEYLILSLVVIICCCIEGDKLIYCEKGNVIK